MKFPVFIKYEYIKRHVSRNPKKEKLRNLDPCLFGFQRNDVRTSCFGSETAARAPTRAPEYLG